MSIFAGTSRDRMPLCALAVAAAFVVGAFVLLPGVARAQADDEEVKPCASCHSDEADAWQTSPHATANDPATGMFGASCESCHGGYVRGHPDEALAPLRVDATICRDCHEVTFEQWENSIHGDEGVECISCHLPHSQEVRLTDEQQCKACHQESLTDSLHTAHWQSEAACTDCHMASMPNGAALAAANPALAALAVPSHDFVSVSADNCLDCHREDVALGSKQPDAQEIAYKEAMAEVPILNADLASARQNNRSLTVLSVANLGFGVGIGGILGIVFMVLFVRMSRRGQ